MKRMLILMFLQNMNFVFSAGSLPESVTAEICIITEEAEKFFFSQNTFMDNNCCDCRSYFGRELVDCMAYSEKQVFIETLSSMDAHSLKSYLQSMNYQDYEGFVQRLSEGEWQTVLEKLSLADSEDFLKTLKGQIEMLQEMYLKAVGEAVRSLEGEKGRVNEQLKCIEKETMPFAEKKAFIYKKIRDYYACSPKIGLEGIVKLHDEIDTIRDSMFEDEKAKIFN